MASWCNLLIWKFFRWILQSVLLEVIYSSYKFLVGDFTLKEVRTHWWLLIRGDIWDMPTSLDCSELELRMFSECQHLSDYLIWPHLEWNFSLNSQLHHFLESLNLWYWRGPDSELSDLSIWTLTKTSRGIDQHVPFGSLTFITVCACSVAQLYLTLLQSHRL